MPFTFSGFNGAGYTAKPGVVSDGDTFLVSATDGYTLTSTLNTYTFFVGQPTRSGVGVWSITLKDTIVELLDFEVVTLTASGQYLSTQKNVPTLDTNGRTVLHWTFNNAGTPADFSTGHGVQQFVVYVSYCETRI